MTDSAVSRSEWPGNVCKTINDAITLPECADAPTRREQVFERVIGEQFVPMIGEELEQRTRREYAHGHLLDTQKVMLAIITTPHSSSPSPQPAKSLNRALAVQINQQSPRTYRISRSSPMFPRGISDGSDAAVSS